MFHKIKREGSKINPALTIDEFYIYDNIAPNKMRIFLPFVVSWKLRNIISVPTEFYQVN